MYLNSDISSGTARLLQGTNYKKKTLQFKNTKKQKIIMLQLEPLRLNN